MHHITWRSSGRVTAAILSLAVGAACSDRVTAPAARVAAPAAGNTSVAPAPSTYLVLARGNGFPADFANTVAALGGKVVTMHQGTGFAVVSGLTAATAATLAGNSKIADVQVNQSLALHSPVAPVKADAAATSGVSARGFGNPAAAILGSWQWNMTAIHAPAAWAAGKLGDPGVTVAIIDSGIDYDSFDLNGRVDLSRSTSFIPSDDAINAQYFGRNNVSDFNGHGTNVATQVASNAVFFAGVTAKTTLIGVKVLGFDGTGDFGAALNGILWAADHGADVANLSLGATFLKAGAGRLTSILNRVFNYAKQRGMLIVAAAGNDGEDLDHDGNEANAFCDMVHVVCVSATGPVVNPGPLDLPAFYTDFGRSAISVAAPGGNADLADGLPFSLWPWGPDFASWVWSMCSKTAIDGFTSAGVPITTTCGDGFGLFAAIGTSQAAPHVSGLAALLVAANGHGKPQQIRAAIEKSADDLGQPGTDPIFGHGRINVAKAVGF